MRHPAAAGGDGRRRHRRPGGRRERGRRSRHVRGTIALLPLLDSVLTKVGDTTPVVAAGGIGTAGAVKAVLAAGADAARVGTRFVAAEEADTHPEYADALVKAGPEDTVLTTAFGVMWPDAPHRVLKSSVDAAEGFECDSVGE